jgi:hypothetical protein
LHHALNTAARSALLALTATMLAAPAAAQSPSWVDQKLLEAAKKEGAPVV